MVTAKRVIEDDDLEADVMEEAMRLADSIGHGADVQPQQPQQQHQQQALPPQAPSSDIVHSSPSRKKSNYGDYLRRRAAGPSQPGSKSIPQGSPGCLLGLTFVFTGELSSISREDATDLVKRLGGRVTGAPSNRTDYVVLGDMAGEGKMDKVRRLGLKTLDEDGLFELIKEQSAGGAKPDEKPPSPPKRPSPNKRPSPKKKEPIAGSTHLPPSLSSSDSLWTAKYAPRCSTDLIGNHSIYESLVSWLNLDRREVKAALLSGPPGIGKTTMAHLAARVSNCTILELNASDCRNKATIEESVKEVINNTAISADFWGAKKSAKGEHLQRQVLIMDEVDGMSSGDRGGVAELIAMIKKTRIPIICCCNDRSSPKIRTLATYCLDLRLRRPDARQIQSRVQEICSSEGLGLQANVVEELVASTRGDIRQILNCLSTFRLSGKAVMTYDQAKAMHGKDIDEGTFDTTIKLLGGQYDRMSVTQRLDAYFVDSSLIPLMVHENYLKAKAPGGRPMVEQSAPSQLELCAAAAEAISASERVELMIRGSNQEWSLAPLHGFMSCVLPAYYVHGVFSGQPAFPSWFGFNSRSGKCARLLRELSHHTFSKLRATPTDFRMYFADSMGRQFIDHMKTGEVGKAVDYVDSMHLCRDDVDSLLDVCGLQNEWASISGIQRGAFSRKYNSTSHKLPYAIGSSSSGRSIKVQDLDVGAHDGEDGEDDEASGRAAGKEQEEGTEDDDIAADKMISAKKHKVKKTAKPKKK